MRITARLRVSVVPCARTHAATSAGSEPRDGAADVLLEGGAEVGGGGGGGREEEDEGLPLTPRSMSVATAEEEEPSPPAAPLLRRRFMSMTVSIVLALLPGKVVFGEAVEGTQRGLC